MLNFTNKVKPILLLTAKADFAMHTPNKAMNCFPERGKVMKIVLMMLIIFISIMVGKGESQAGTDEDCMINCAKTYPQQQQLEQLRNCLASCPEASAQGPRTRQPLSKEECNTKCIEDVKELVISCVYQVFDPPDIDWDTTKFICEQIAYLELEKCKGNCPAE